ncbi:MAG: type IX secretion system protein PorQ [Flavobacteriales bacterium]
MRFLGLLVSFLLSFSSIAQIGGKSTYQFLNIISSAKIASLGGYTIAVPDGDIEMAYFNPALIDSSLHQELNLNYVNYFSDINYGFAGYAYRLKKIGVFTTSIKYINYGEFLLTDETSAINGEFSSSETALNIGWSNAYKYGLKYGVNLKFVMSNFYDYTSTGILVDIAGTWSKPEKGIIVGMVVKNMGSQITTYTPNNFEPMPFEIQAGVSKKLQHAPFRFSANFHNLQVFDFYYDSPNEIESSSLFGGDVIEEDKSHLAEIIFRHFTIGTELLLSENFNLRIGYNHQRRSELKLREGSKAGAVGFNFGIGVHIKKFKIDYGRSIYSLAGTTNHLSISTNFSEYISKKDKKDKK